MKKIDSAGRRTGNPASPSRRLRRPCGSILSACLLACALPAAQAAPSALEQAERAATAAMQQLLQTHARQQDWQGMEYRLQHQALGAEPAAPCPSAPRLQQIGGDPDPLQRQRFLLRCAELGWELTLQSQAEVFLPMVVAARVLERDGTITAADLKLEKTDLAKARRGFFNRIEPVLGQSAKRRIRVGQLLSPNLLGAPLLVRRGERVKIVASQDGIQASASGEALNDGKRGETIRVRNLASEKVIDARVLEAGVVSSTFN